MFLKRVGVVVLVMVVVLFQSACSFVFAKGPPSGHKQMAYFDCSDGVGWPLLDTLVAGLNVVEAGVYSGDDMNPDQQEMVTFALARVAVWGASAIYGYTQVAACADAKKELRLRAEQNAHPQVAAPAPAGSPVAPPPAAAPSSVAPAAAPSAAPAAPSSAAPAAPSSAAPAAPSSVAPAAPSAPAPARAPVTSRAETAPMSLSMRPVVDGTR